MHSTRIAASQFRTQQAVDQQRASFSDGSSASPARPRSGWVVFWHAPATRGFICACCASVASLGSARGAASGFVGVRSRVVAGASHQHARPRDDAAQALHALTMPLLSEVCFLFLSFCLSVPRACHELCPFARYGVAVGRWIFSRADVALTHPRNVLDLIYNMCRCLKYSYETFFTAVSYFDHFTDSGELWREIRFVFFFWRPLFLGGIFGCCPTLVDVVLASIPLVVL
jgi:hypothetical protein